MTTKPFFFTLALFPLSKIGQSSFMTQIFGNYLFLIRNPNMLISGSVVTLNSLNQWNIFNINYIFGGSMEQMMIINVLSVLQFMLGWRTAAKKDKSEITSEQKVDSKITTLQLEISELKSRLVHQAV